MATGKQHAAASVGLAAGLGAGYATAYVLDPHQVLYVVLGALMGVIVSPDSDVDGGYIAHYYIRKFTTRAGEWLWSLLWGPYAVAQRHRGFSHIPIISTLHRLLYLVFPAVIFLFPDQEVRKTSLIPRVAVAHLISLPLTIACINFVNEDLAVSLLAPLVAGLVLSDILHLLFDI